MPYIICMASDDSDDIKATAATCAKKLNFSSYNQVMTCAEGQEGNSLLHQNALKTKAQNPAYVPWIVLNGVHTEAIEAQALNGLNSLFCQNLKVSAPFLASSNIQDIKTRIFFQGPGIPESLQIIILE